MRHVLNRVLEQAPRLTTPPVTQDEDVVGLLHGLVERKGPRQGLRQEGHWRLVLPWLLRGLAGCIHREDENAVSLALLALEILGVAAAAVESLLQGCAIRLGMRPPDDLGALLPKGLRVPPELSPLRRQQLR